MVDVNTSNPWTSHRIRPDGKVEIPLAVDSDTIVGLALDGDLTTLTGTDDGPLIQAALEKVEDGDRPSRLMVHGNAGQICYINSTITISQSQTVLDSNVMFLFGPDARVRPWGTIDEQPVTTSLKPSLTADAPVGTTVLHVDMIPGDWAVGDYLGLRGNRTASGAVLSNQIFHSYVSAINVGALTITLATALDEDYFEVNDTTWSNKESQLTKVTQATLTGTPDAGDVTIAVSDSTIFAVGDFVQVIDDTNTLDDGGAVQDGNFAHKEQAIIAEIPNGTSMKLSHALQHSYDTGNNARVQKLNMLEDVKLPNWRIRFAETPSETQHAIEVRYAYNTHVTDFDIIGGGDDGESWSGHAIRFTDSLSCSASRGAISNPSDVTPGRGYGISFYGATLCWAEGVEITGCRHSFLWFNGASACWTTGCTSTDARISDYDWHGADCANNWTTGCTAIGGTRTTGDSSGRTAWKFGNPSHRPGDRANTATDCLVVSYAGAVVEGIPSSAENVWQGVVRGADVGIKLGPLAIDTDQPLPGFVIRNSEFYDVATPLDIDGGADKIVTDLLIDNNTWTRCGQFVIANAPRARFTRNRVIDPDVGTDYILDAVGCPNLQVKGNDFSDSYKGLAFQACPDFRCTNNDLHDLTGSTVVFRDNGGNAGYLFRDNDYIGYTPTSSIGTASAGTLELLRVTGGGGGGGGGTYPPAGGVPFADLDVSLQGVVSGAYVFPGGGIPETDLAAAVSTSLGKADTAYQLPVGGIPDTDLATPGGGGYAADMPSEHTYDEWNYDPAIASSSTAATAGRLEMMRVRVRSSGTRTKAVISVATAAAGLTSAYAAVFDDAGNQLAVTMDISATITSTGVKSLTMAANYALTAGQDVYVAILQVGGTPAAFHRAVTSAGLGNAGLNAAAGYRFMSSGSGLTAMPSTVSITSGTSSANTYWCALG